MQLLLKKGAYYTKTVFTLSVLTVLCALGCAMLGYVFLPFAAGFYASLLIYEKANKKLVSVILPIILFIINFLVNGICSLEAIAYVALGCVIYFAVKKGASKGETAFWLSLVSSVLIVLSAILLAFKVEGFFGVDAIKLFYSELYRELKAEFMNLLSTLTVTVGDESFFAYSAQEAELMFHQLVILLIPTLIIVSIAISGISLKIFCRSVRKYSGEECGIDFWKFRTSNLIAYFYVILAIINLFSAGESGVAALVILSLNTVFSVIFAYMGVSLIYTLLSHRKGPFFALSVIVIGCMIFSSYATQLLSFLGVYYNIVTNRISPKNND